MADASRAPGKKGFDKVDHFLCKQETSDALGAEKAFVSCECEGVNVHRFHIDGTNASGLGAIDDELQVICVTKAADFEKWHYSAADVAGVEHDDGNRVFTYGFGELTGV